MLIRVAVYVHRTQQPRAAWFVAVSSANSTVSDYAPLPLCVLATCTTRFSRKTTESREKAENQPNKYGDE